MSIEEWRGRFWSYRTSEIFALCIVGFLFLIGLPLYEAVTGTVQGPDTSVFGTGDPRLVAGNIASGFVQTLINIFVFVIAWYFGFLIYYLFSYFGTPKIYDEFGDGVAMRITMEIGLYVIYSALFYFMLDKYSGTFIGIGAAWLAVLAPYIFIFMRSENH